MNNYWRKLQYLNFTKIKQYFYSKSFLSLHLKTNKMKTKLLAIIVIAFIFCVKQSHAQFSYENDTVSFENPETNILIDTLGGNLWQIGVPQKTYFFFYVYYKKQIYTVMLYLYGVLA